MPTQRKSAKSSKKSSGKSTSKSSQSRSSSRGSSNARGSGKTASAKSRSSGGKSSAAKRSRSQSRSGSSGARKTQGTRRGKTANALELLMQDHREVQKMFRKGERMESDDRGLQELVETACAALTLHAEIEEQLFYPALQEQGDDEDTVQEAYVEHDSAKQLIAQLQSMQPGDERYKATFKVLGEYVNHHIEEEESTIFRLARKAKLDMEALGEQILMIKQGGEGAGEGMAGAGGAAKSGERSSSRRGGNSGGSSARGRSRGGASGSDSSRSGGSSANEDDASAQGGMDDEETGAAAGSRGGGSGDSAEESERPGRGGRQAHGAEAGDGDADEIDVETPGGSSRYGSH